MNEALAEMMQLNQWVAYNAQKVPFGAGGVAASTTNPETWQSYDEAVALCEILGLAGVGFVMSKDDDFVGIDLDNAIDDAGTVKPWAWAIMQTVDSYTEVSPSGRGLHIWVKGKLPKRGGSRTKPEGADGLLEVYESARYFTVTGEHIRSPLEIRQFVGLPAFYHHHFGPTVGESYDPNRWKMRTQASAEDIQGALDHIPADDYQIWTDVGMALKHELGANGFEMWRAWSATSVDKYPGDAKCWRKWESFRGDGITIRSLFRLAIDNGYEPKRGWEKAVESVALDTPEPVESSTGAGGDAAKALFFDAAELAQRTERREYLIGPAVAGQGDMIVIAGPPKSMKSFIVLDLLTHLSRGESWHGIEPARALRAVMLNLELHQDAVADRLKLLRSKAAPGHVFISDRMRNGLDPAAAVNLKGHVDAFGVPDVLIVDPIANAFDGDNENDNAQMSTFMGDLEKFRDTLAPGAVLILVHHTRKTTEKEMAEDPFGTLRGASAIRGRYDTGVVVYREKKTQALALSFEMRNGEALPDVKLTYDEGQFSVYEEVSDAKTKSDWEILQSVMIGMPPMNQTDCARAAMVAEEGIKGEAQSAKTWTRRLADAVNAGLVDKSGKVYSWRSE